MYSNQITDDDNMDFYDKDWLNLILQAKALGLTPKEVKLFLKGAVNNKAENDYSLDPLNL